MIRRVIHCFPKTITAPPSFLFSAHKPNPKKKFTPPSTSRKLETMLRQYIVNLQRNVKEKEKRFERLKKNPRAQEQAEETQNSGDGSYQDLWKKTKNSLFLLALMIFLFPSAGEDEMLKSNSHPINQQQMLTLLAKGGFNQQLIIFRDVLTHDQHGKDIYQTLCTAKYLGQKSIPKTCIVHNLSNFLTALEDLPQSYNVNFSYAQKPVIVPLSPFWGTFIMLGFGYLFFRYLRGRTNAMMGNNGNDVLNQLVGNKKFEPIKPDKIQTYFKDVAGMHEAKSEITQFVDFLKFPDKYLDMGAKIPKGALLTGPPGTGKTLLARACAGQAGVPFFYVSGSEFVEKYVGLGASRVRSLFDSASKAAPSIIFIDEIDAIGKKRNSGPFANEEKQNTLNQLLVNMDGFDSKSKIIVMAATNLKDSLDPALLRPGRFDRSVQIGLPNFEERVEILKVHLQKVKFSKKFTINEVAKKVSVLTPGFSGAQLANICNEAAILAARANKKYIDIPEFEKATERVMAGLQKRNLFSEEQKECLAYYECGKAVVSWFSEGADPVIKISIAPFSKQHTGYSHEIKDEMPLKTKEELLNKAACFLAGRTAQLHFKGYTTSNGDTDMGKVKRLITFMVVKFGMSSIGTIGFPDVQYVRKPYSAFLERRIDVEVQKLFKQCQEDADRMVKERTEQIETLKELIMKKETLSHNSIKEVLGERPFADHENYQKFLKDLNQNQPEKEKQQVEQDTSATAL